MKWQNKRTLTVIIGLIVAIIILLSSNLMAIPDLSESDPQLLFTPLQHQQISLTQTIISIVQEYLNP
ncbi:hypothetical protein GCM10009122_06710 [Fulvivirga kasyanovii]